MSYQKSRELRQRIDDAAYKLFSENGYNNVTLLDIAKEVGISRTTLYYYYRNKYAIADHLLDLQCEKVDFLTQECINIGMPLLEIAILPFFIFLKTFEKNIPLGEIYFTGFDFENRLPKEIELLKSKYSYPAIWKLFDECGQPLSEDDKTAILLSINAIWRSFLRAATNGILPFSSRQILDNVFCLTILNRLQIPKETYEKHANAIEQFINEHYI
ncbi:TetR/AcrR family transcriptional regulator [Clostridium sp.]|uniref:TetR/AcrR family transcriptional regulator n=1 Tax=Clostridium sp. TaxID=1506 RepID=UPI0032179DAA